LLTRHQTMIRWRWQINDTGKRGSAHSLRASASRYAIRLSVEFAVRDSDLGLGPNAPFFAVRLAAAIPDLIEAVAAEGHDVMIVAPKPARQVFGLSGRIRPVRVGFPPAEQMPERREALGSEVAAGPGSLPSRLRERLLQGRRLRVEKRPEREERRAVFVSVQTTALLCGCQDDRLGKRLCTPRVAAEQRVPHRGPRLRGILWISPGCSSA